MLGCPPGPQRRRFPAPAVISLKSKAIDSLSSGRFSGDLDLLAPPPFGNHRQ